MDQTASEVNLRYSLKRFLIPQIKTVRGKNISFDITLLDPNLNDKSVSEWIVVKIGNMGRGGMSSLLVDFVCLSRKDFEGDKLAGLSDVVFDVMTDSEQPDGKRRIPFYNPTPTPTQFGSLLVQDCKDGGEMFAPDRTKVKIINCRLRWAAKA
ncbi:MAG: hypothetical protein WA151_02220 [Desulfatirhabdiaceae bacterium]